MPPIVVVLGATATGKTGLGIELAEALDGEVINADALQVYRRLDIGTAKPTPDERSRVPHHLLDILEPEEPFSAGAFARHARTAIDDIEARGRVPVVVGGSGLYLRALIEGLAPLPPVDRTVREALDRRIEEEGLAALYRELCTRDPETAERLAPGDRQRISRALEIVLGTGRRQSDWIRERPFGQAPLAAVRIGLTMPRSILYDRLADRVHGMVERGWVAEVEALLDEGVDPDVPAFQAIGYRQMVAHLRHDSSLRAAIDETIHVTRRYAKRQSTWFRREPDVFWVPALELPASIPSLLRTLRLRRRMSAE